MSSLLPLPLTSKFVRLFSVPWMDFAVCSVTNRRHRFDGSMFFFANDNFHKQTKMMMQQNGHPFCGMIAGCGVFDAPSGSGGPSCASHITQSMYTMLSSHSPVTRSPAAMHRGGTEEALSSSSRTSQNVLNEIDMFSYAHMADAAFLQKQHGLLKGATGDDAAQLLNSGCRGMWFAAMPNSTATNCGQKQHVTLTVAGCGDIRCFGVKKGCSGGAAIVPLSEDHRPTRPAEHKRITAAGGVIKNGKLVSTMANYNKGGNDVTAIDCAVDVSRGFGHYPFKTNSKLGPVDQQVVATPCTEEWAEMGPGDVVVAASYSLFEGRGGAVRSLDSVADVVVSALSSETDDVGTVAVRLCDAALQSNCGGESLMVAVGIVKDTNSWKKDSDDVLLPTRSSSFVVPGALYPFAIRHHAPFADAFFSDCQRMGDLPLPQWLERRYDLLAGAIDGREGDEFIRQVLCPVFPVECGLLLASIDEEIAFFRSHAKNGSKWDEAERRRVFGLLAEGLQRSAATEKKNS